MELQEIINRVEEAQKTLDECFKFLIEKRREEIGEITDFENGYIEAILFTSQLEKEHDVSSFSAEALQSIKHDCMKFETAWQNVVAGREYEAGQDFWFTRNSEGAGFWDGDWEEETGRQLTKAAKKFKPVDVYVENGIIYFAQEN